MKQQQNTAPPENAQPVEVRTSEWDELVEEIERRLPNSVPRARMTNAMWSVISDIMHSYVLAMKATGLSEEQIESITSCVMDYAVNHYD